MEYHGIDSRGNNPEVHFDEAQLAMFAADNAAHAASLSLKDELTLAAGKVTPGVDDTPYIQYALRALVGDQGESSSHGLSSGSNEDDRYLPPRNRGDGDMGSGSDFAQSHEQYGYPNIVTGADQNLSVPPQPMRPSSATFDTDITPSKRWVAVTQDMRRRTDPHGSIYQSLTFKPRILRPISMLIFMFLCLLMTAALIFSVKFSQSHDGALTPYPGSIYSGQYFLFRILPQLLGAVIFIYAQCIVTTSLRIIPFAALASETTEERYMAIFQELYPSSFLLPKIAGPWQHKVFSAAAWLALFTIPLQSSAFTCVFTETKWMWAPVQDVVWTLVALYLVLFVATIPLAAYWFRRWTGLIWDVRSIGDLLPLLNRSNGMASYRQGELAEERADFKTQLRERWFDRLGYWRTEDMVTGGVWYTLGVSGEDGDAKTQTQSSSLIPKQESNDASHLPGGEATPLGSIDGGRGKHLPWLLRDGPMYVLISVAIALLVALLVVSFLPQTRLESGFRVGITARPDGSAFSPADFTFSFIPSLIGMILLLLFQSIDLALRIQQPWAGFYEVEGSPARESLMADYAACLPLQATLHASVNGHWRAALVSLMATLSIFIPVLGGGFLMALTGPDGKVRMYPNMAVFGVLLALVVAYVGGLSLLVPFRGRISLPRSVTRIADMISLCSADELVQDAAFRSVRSRQDLAGRLGIRRDSAREESRWVFGLVAGREESRVSVRRAKRGSEAAGLVESMA